MRPSNSFSCRYRYVNRVKFATEAGIGPVKLFDRRFNDWSSFRFSIHPPISPPKLFPSSPRWAKELSFPMLRGTCPDKLFSANRRYSRPVDRSPTDWGMDPCSLLEDSESDFREWQFVNALKNSHSLSSLAWSWLSSRFRLVRFESFPKETGIFPVNLLFDKSNF